MTNEHILKVGIAPMEQFKARTMVIARGEYKLVFRRAENLVFVA